MDPSVVFQVKEGRPANICSSCKSGGSLIKIEIFRFWLDRIVISTLYVSFLNLFLKTLSHAKLHVVDPFLVSTLCNWFCFVLKRICESNAIVVLHCFRLFLYKLLKCQSMQGSYVRLWKVVPSILYTSGKKPKVVLGLFMNLTSLWRNNVDIRLPGSVWHNRRRNSSFLLSICF